MGALRKFRIVGALVLLGLGPAVCADTGVFSIEDSLRLENLLQPPSTNPQHPYIAYLVADWQRADAIKALKPLGKLLVQQGSDGPFQQLAEQASDAVWSRSGDSLAYFEGLGPERRLTLTAYPRVADEPSRVPVAGELSRYSARHFPPLWGQDDRSVIVAEAVFHDPAVSQNQPYTVATEDQRLASDSHFRDDTLWRLVRVEVQTLERTFITSELALRQIMPSPDGAALALSYALHQGPGQFAGDTYMQPQENALLMLRESVPPASLASLPAGELVGWSDTGSLLLRRAEGLQQIDLRNTGMRASTSQRSDAAVNDPVSEPVNEPAGKPVGEPAVAPADATSNAQADEPLDGSSIGRPKAIAWPFSHPARITALAGDWLVAAGAVGDAAAASFMVPPPAAEYLSVASLRSGKTWPLMRPQDGREILQLAWLPGGERLLVHSRRLDTLAEQLMVWSHGQSSVLLDEDAHISMLAVSAPLHELVFSLQRSDRPADLHHLGLGGGPLRPAEHLNSHFTGRQFASSRLVSGHTAEGEQWRALLYLPGEQSASKAGQQVAQPVPLVATAYTRLTQRKNEFNAEAQMHTARGIAFLLPDVFPHKAALHRAYAAVIPAALAEVKARFGLQGKSGFYGGSLGGYAGLVLLTRSRALDAAVLRAPPSEFSMSWATGKDRDADLLEYLMGNTTPWQAAQAYRDDSPFWMADQVSAPLLILHGSDDAQVPLEQGEWMFQAIRRLAKAPVALRVYPGADHSIVRANQAYYLDFYQQLFSWWDDYLLAATAGEK